MTAELTMLHVHSGAIGYGRLGVQLASALTRRGVDVFDVLDKPGGNVRDSDRKLNEGLREKRTKNVCWVSVPTHARGWFEGQLPHIFTMWEATVLPESFRETLHHFDTVLVPSEHNVELFSKYHPNVQYVPLGIDPDWWAYSERRKPERFFDVLIGGSGPRKGTDLANEAFHAAFPDGWHGDGPEPRLVMKNPKGEPFHSPRVEMIAGRLSAEDERDLYASAHVYLQPSRGEGFGLQPLQAIAQGLPTILTDAHGHVPFAHLGMPVSATLEPAAYFIYGDAGDWWLPNVDEIVDLLRYSYEHYDEVSARAERNSSVARDVFTWDRCATEFVAGIGEDRLCEPYGGSGDWFTPDARRYLVRVIKPWRADIAGKTYQFLPERDYWEMADVKRILFEGELLDPSCVRLDGDDDLGLTEAQLERVPLYSAAHAYCLSCGQQLGSRPTRAEDLMAASA